MGEGGTGRATAAWPTASQRPALGRPQPLVKRCPRPPAGPRCGSAPCHRPSWRPVQSRHWPAALWPAPSVRPGGTTAPAWRRAAGPAPAPVPCRAAPARRQGRAARPRRCGCRPAARYWSTIWRRPVGERRATWVSVRTASAHCAPTAPRLELTRVLAEAQPGRAHRFCVEMGAAQYLGARSQLLCSTVLQHGDAAGWLGPARLHHQDRNKFHALSRISCASSLTYVAKREEMRVAFLLF